MTNKKGATQFGKWIIWILIALAILYLIAKLLRP